MIIVNTELQHTDQSTFFHFIFNETRELKKIVCLLAFIVAIFNSAAFSHSKLQSSTPGNGDTLMESPRTLEMVFNKDVRLIKVEIASSSGDIVDTNFIPSKKASSNYGLNLPSLNPGDYEVNWVAMGGDGHKIKGTLSFKVQGVGAIGKTEMKKMKEKTMKKMEPENQDH